jgi:hypothetical protein
MAEAIRNGLRLEAIAAVIAGEGDTPGSDWALTTTSRSRSHSRSSCFVSERSIAAALTAGRPCGRSPVCGCIPSAASFTTTTATSRSPASSSPCSKFSWLSKAVSSVPKSR